MTESEAISSTASARRFTVAADGTTTGDDGDSGRLALSLRYACRVAGQLDLFTGAGDLEWVRAIGSTTVTVRVGWGQGSAPALSAEVGAGEPRTPKDVVVVGGADVHAALGHCMQRVGQMLGTHWSAVITGDKRVVAAAVPRSGTGLLDPVAALPEVGVRALAVLGALEERYRETCVLLDYAHGTTLVAAIGDHALVAFADRLDTRVVADIVDEVRAILVPGDVARAEAVTIVETPTTSPVEEQVPPASRVPARSTGMRHRAVRPRRSRWGRRSR
ncbi:hypothetical protein [Nocardioides sp. P5_C9_2]